MGRDVRKFLLKMLLFLLPLALILGYMEVRLRGMETTYSIKKRDFIQQKDSIEILVLGSSHALFGIDPSQFSQEAYNLSNSSQTLYYDAQLTEKYLDAMPLLKTVFIPVSYFSLWYQLGDTRESWRAYFYKKYWGISSPAIRPLDVENFSYTALYTPAIALHYAHRGFQDSNVTGALQPTGWIPAKPHETNILTDSAGRARVHSHDIILFENRLHENVGDLEKLVKLLKNRSIEPVFITIPVCTTYSKFAKPEILETNNKILTGLSQRYNFQYFNYFSDTRFTIADFNDSDHLNPQGAVKFSKILNEDAFLKTNANDGSFKKQ